MNTNTATVENSTIENNTVKNTRTRKNNGKNQNKKVEFISEKIKERELKLQEILSFAGDFDKGMLTAKSAVDKVQDIFKIDNKEKVYLLTGFLAECQEWPLTDKKDQNGPLSVNTILAAKGKWCYNSEGDYYFKEGAENLFRAKGCLVRLVNTLSKRFYVSSGKKLTKFVRFTQGDYELIMAQIASLQGFYEEQGTNPNTSKAVAKIALSFAGDIGKLADALKGKARLPE